MSDLQKKSFQIPLSPSQLLLANPIGRGAIFIFGAKIGLKSTKNVVFCILIRPMGGEARAPPPPLATQLMPIDGGYFSAKIDLKSAKNGVFCILFRPMEGAPRPPPWIRYGPYQRIVLLSKIEAYLNVLTVRTVCTIILALCFPGKSNNYSIYCTVPKIINFLCTLLTAQSLKVSKSCQNNPVG